MALYVELTKFLLDLSQAYALIKENAIYKMVQSAS